VSARPQQRSPRAVALDVVRAVSSDDAYANLLLPTRLRRARLSGQDAGFVTELVYGTLRRRGLYDAIIAHASGRAVASIDPVALDVLRLGAHQLLGMQTPPHAAVGESVALAKRSGATRAAGFINAVLRRVSERSEAEWVALLQRESRSVDERLAIEFAHPTWVVEALRSALEREGRADELALLLESDNVPPRVSLVALPGLADVAEAGPPGSLSPLAAIAPLGDPSEIPAVAEGRVRVQDEGSQLAALALSRVSTAQLGERWLDLCAGPGGKAALLAVEARRAGARLTANEVSPARAGLVRAALSAVDPEVEVRTGDGRRVGAVEPGAYDRVLVDAPCSGLGALRRRPEARWRKQPDDVAELSALQLELLRSAIQAVRPGGVVAYVTCSPLPIETTGVVDALLANPPTDVTPLDTREVLDSIAGRALDLAPLPHGAAQLWPHRHGSDAMFVQLLRRSL